jgi:hypothetical protein
MNGLAVAIQTSAIGMAIVFIVLVTGAALLIAAAYVFSQKDGRKSRLKKAARKILAAFCLLFAVTASWRYYLGQSMRANAHACTQQFPSNRGRYRAEHCHLGREQMLLRVYDARTGTLLADRTYWAAEDPKLIWTDDSVFDLSGPDDMTVSLPPTLLDHMLAKLP